MDTKVIQLKNSNLVAVVDEEDYEKISKYKWRAVKYRNTFYAEANINNKTVHMHKMILIVASGLLVDHRDGNGLNNSKSNLRAATPTQNNANCVARSKSGFKGVTWSKSGNTWRAQIKINRKLIYLGSFRSAESAARAYDKKATELFGEFARLNFPCE